MKALSKICDKLDKFFKFFYYFSGVIMMVLLAVSCFVVFARQFLNYSPIWSDEVQRFLMVAMVFFSIPYMASSKSFLVVDLTEIFFSKRKKLHETTILIGDIIFIVLLVYLVFPCITLVQKNTEVYSTALAMPMAYMYALLPMSFLLGAIAMMKNIIRRFVLSKSAA